MKLLSLFWHSVEPDSIPQQVFGGTEPTASMFRDHIKFLTSNYTPISISDFVNIARNKDMMRSYAKPPILLGFDDGFRNVLTHALPILNEFRVPVVFFVIGEILKNPNFMPWYVEVRHLIRKAEHKNLVYGNGTFNLLAQQDCMKLVGLFEASFRLCRSELDRQRLLMEFATQLGVDRPMASDLAEDLRFVDKEDLARLSSSSLLSIGSHAMTHRFLASLSYEEQIYELEQSDSLLRKHCSAYYPAIAYPSGSYNADTIAIAESIYKAGFAATTLGTSYRNLYAYPRVGINRGTVQYLSYAISSKRLNYLLPLKRFLNIVGIRRAN